MIVILLMQCYTVNFLTNIAENTSAHIFQVLTAPNVIPDFWPTHPYNSQHVI